MGFGEQVAENMERQRRYRTANALMQDLPADGKWTIDERAKWHHLFGVTLDYCTEIVEPEEK